MRCAECGGMSVSNDEATGRQTPGWSEGEGCVCMADTDPVTRLLRLLTLLANCGLSAGAPPVLKTQRQN